MIKSLDNGGKGIAPIDSRNMLLFSLGGAEEEGVDFICRRTVMADVGDEAVGAVDPRFEKKSG